eukprot:1470767-Pyramimonas_sp.AAC.1
MKLCHGCNFAVLEQSCSINHAFILECYIRECNFLKNGLKSAPDLYTNQLFFRNCHQAFDPPFTTRWRQHPDSYNVRRLERP